MKNLPYFKWYPADAEMDAKYRVMDDAERGFYLTCLNYSWINGGLPSNAEDRARVLGKKRTEADKRWLRVGVCFQPSNSDPTMLVNPRQEVERSKAIDKSKKATDAVKIRYGRKANATQESSDSVTPRAVARADSDYVSESVSEVFDVSSEESLRETTALTVRELKEPNDLFALFWGLFVAAGKPLSDSDKERTLKAWLCFEQPEHETMIRWTAEQIHGVWTSVKYTPMPYNVIEGKHWQRVAQPRIVKDPQRELSASERATQEAGRIARARGYK